MRPTKSHPAHELPGCYISRSAGSAVRHGRLQFLPHSSRSKSGLSGNSLLNKVHQHTCRFVFSRIIPHRPSPCFSSLLRFHPQSLSPLPWYHKFTHERTSRSNSEPTRYEKAIRRTVQWRVQPSQTLPPRALFLNGHVPRSRKTMYRKSMLPAKKHIRNNNQYICSDTHLTRSHLISGADAKAHPLVIAACTAAGSCC